MWYMGIDSNNKPNGWSPTPVEGYIEVSDEVRAIHELNPDYVWNGSTLVHVVIPPIPDPVPEIPNVVTMRQARLALLSRGMLAGIDAAVQSMGEAAKIEWEFADTVARSHPLVQAIGLTQAQLDELFVEAAAL